MSPVLTAVLLLAAIGAVCAVLLAVASKYMSVPVDEKFPAVRECLPGANCGACGYAGCDGYAAALASGEETKTNKCIAGGAEVAKALADTLGVGFEDVERKNAFVHCRGKCDRKSELQGEHSCAAAKLLFSGDRACAYGCLGYGDCAAVCPEGAINIINGVAHVNPARCTGCGLCTKTCPQHIIEVLPSAITPLIGCSSHDKGPAVKKICASGCIGCSLCSKKCPAGAIRMENDLPVIDYGACTGCGVCIAACPCKAILNVSAQ